MSITGNIIDVQKIQLTDTFQTWFAKTNEIVDALNPVNIYDLDGGSGTYVTYGLSGTDYNGVKSVNVNAGYGVAVGVGSGKPWTGVVGLDISSISGNAYTLTGNESKTAGTVYTSEVNNDDYFLVLDANDPTQGPNGTTKVVKAQHMMPRTLWTPQTTFKGNIIVDGDLSVLGAGSSIAASTLSVSDKFIYLGTTGTGGLTAPANQASVLGSAGIVISISGAAWPATNKEIVWNYNSANDYITFNTNYGAKRLTDSLVNSKFIARNFVGGDGATSNAFVFEAAGGSATRMWLTESGSNPYFGIVKDSASSNVNFNVYQGAGITSVAYIRAGATSQYTGVTANAFIQFANVDMVDGAHAVTGASAWTIPVSDGLGELRPDRHNAGQIKRRFTQANHGLTTGEAVTVVPSTFATVALRGTLTGAQANNPLTEAIGIVDRVISANEVSVTMKGYMELSANRLKGIGTPATGAYYVLDWNVQGGLTTNTNTPSGYVYQPLFLALGGSAGIVYGNEGEQIFPNATDEVYMRGMIPIGMIQPYAGALAGLTMGLSGGSIPVSDIQYNENYLPCDGRAVSATGASGFVDLYNLIGVSYPMRGTVESNDGDAFIRIRMDRGTSNLSALSFGSGVVRAIRRSGPNSVHQEYSKTYSSFTADSSTVTISGSGITTQNTQLGPNIIVDLLTPKDGQFFFLPDMRGKAPFGEYGPLGARGEEFNLGGTGGTTWAGATGATAVGYGGLVTNFVIRARREADALILTGHNHDSRYFRKDVNDTADAGTTLNLQNLNVAGSIVVNSNGTFNNPVTINNRLTVTGAATFTNGINVTNVGITGTLLTAAQPNITSVGVLTAPALNVTGALTVTGASRFVGNSTFANGIDVTNGITGTLLTAAQPNVTSVGTLSSLAVDGNSTVSGVGTFGSFIQGASISVTGSAVLKGAVGMEAGLTVTGASRFNSIVRATNALHVTGGLVVTGSSRFNNDVVVAGGKVTSSSTVATDAISTCTTKNYVDERDGVVAVTVLPGVKIQGSTNIATDQLSMTAQLKIFTFTGTLTKKFSTTKLLFLLDPITLLNDAEGTNDFKIYAGMIHSHTTGNGTAFGTVTLPAGRPTTTNLGISDQDTILLNSVIEIGANNAIYFNSLDAVEGIAAGNYTNLALRVYGHAEDYTEAGIQQISIIYNTGHQVQPNTRLIVMEIN